MTHGTSTPTISTANSTITRCITSLQQPHRRHHQPHRHSSHHRQHPGCRHHQTVTTRGNTHSTLTTIAPYITGNTLPIGNIGIATTHYITSSIPAIDIANSTLTHRFTRGTVPRHRYHQRHHTPSIPYIGLTMDITNDTIARCSTGSIFYSSPTTVAWPAASPRWRPHHPSHHRQHTPASPSPRATPSQSTGRAAPLPGASPASP